VAVLVVAGILIFGGGDGDKPKAKPNTVTPPASNAANSSGSDAAKKAAAPKIDRASITVSVLNGTTVTGLARQASGKVTAKGYREGVVTNDTTDQQRPVTQIFYEPNGKAAALDVAKILGVRAVNVKPMDANARVAADRAQVAVFVGTDKAQ
jgi:LytR cell envelope-related transcriptional attenuator